MRTSEARTWSRKLYAILGVTVWLLPLSVVGLAVGADRQALSVGRVVGIVVFLGTVQALVRRGAGRRSRKMGSADRLGPVTTALMTVWYAGLLFLLPWPLVLHVFPGLESSVADVVGMVAAVFLLVSVLAAVFAWLEAIDDVEEGRRGDRLSVS